MAASVAAAVGVGTLIQVVRTHDRGPGGKSRAGDPGVRDLLAEADYELSLGYRARALERLEAAARQARTEASLLSVLKRARRIAADTGDFVPLATLSQLALEHQPASRRIGEVHLYAAVRADSGGKAVAWLSRLSGHRESEAVVTEAYLRGRGAAPELQGLSEEMGRLLSLLQEREPTRLEAAARVHGDPRLWLDCALAWMQTGRSDKAWEAVAQAGQLSAGREAAVYIAYDGGRYQEALSLLDSSEEISVRADLMVLAADASLLLGRHEEAEAGYARALEAWPQHSWSAYLNLAHLRQAQGELEDAARLRAQAHELFPTVEAALLEHARDLRRRGETDRARTVTEDFLREAPGSLAASLFLLDLRGTAASPAVYTAALWELLRQHPGDGPLCRLLVLYLMQLRDFGGAEVALEEYQRASPSGGRAWLEHYRGVLAGLQGDLAGAEAAMGRSVELEPAWRTWYDLGVVQGAAGKARTAIESLRRAEELVQAGGRTAPDAGGGASADRSKIRALIAEQLAALSDLQGARRECEYALDLDPLNHRARLVLRLLEGQ